MKLIAFYLPQYHPVPENDRWWGAGFTEWTNVARARPRFGGHYQPHIPADLGFYDLRSGETRAAQARLAQEYGIGGFCYYHYWFNGKLLLERPLDEVVASGEPDFPFCVCWANENWTRRWDGQEQEVLMSQDYQQYDAAEHMEWLIRLFRDRRYISVQGRPLFLIYRAGDVAHLAEKVRIWKRTAVDNGFPGIYLCYIKNFPTPITDDEFRAMGFEAILEFEPHPSGPPLPLSVPGTMVYAYRDVIRNALAKPKDPKPNFPCVIPSWDNSPRRAVGATVIQNTNPDLFKTWLCRSMQRVGDYEESEQLIFINAWNEWGEGCHLEPDLKMGRGFLEAVRQAIEEHKSGASHPMNDLSDLPRFADDLTSEDHWTEFIRNVGRFRPLFIWGAGDGGLKTLAGLEKAGVAIAGFIDGNSTKWGKELRGHGIHPPGFIFERCECESPFVIIASVYRDEISDDLKKHGLVELLDYLPDYRLPKKDVEKGTVRVQVNQMPGSCNICGADTFKSPSFESDRGLQCAGCGSTPSERMAVSTLVQEFACSELAGLSLHPGLRILEASGLKSFSAYLRMCCQSQSVHFAPGVFMQMMQQNEIPRDLAELPCESGQFDAVLAFDHSKRSIYTHVGYCEIYRVLKENGVMILHREESSQNPASTATFMSSLESIGFQVGMVLRDYPLHAVDMQRIFLCRKKGLGCGPIGDSSRQPARIQILK